MLDYLLDMEKEHPVVKLLFRALIIMVLAYVLPGVTVTGFFAALATAVVLAVLNAVVKPILVFLTLPITVITLGLFMFVINAGLVLLASAIVPGFHVAGFGWALLFSLLLSLINTVI